MTSPSRSEIWHADLDPPRGHEQAGRRPVLVISTNLYNDCPAEMVVILTITSKRKRISWHVFVEAAGTGLRSDSYIMCDSIRAVSKERLGRRIGAISADDMALVDERLQILLEL